MRLAAWRKLEGKTLQQVADGVRVSAMSISRIEKGQQRPSPEVAKKIDSYTRGKVTAASLLGLDTAGAGRNVREESATFEAGEFMAIEIPIDLERLKGLRAQGVDVEGVARAGAERALKEAEARAWAEANREAIEASNRWIEKHGTLAEQLGLI
jgi:antitoxin CcdA